METDDGKVLEGTIVSMAWLDSMVATEKKFLARQEARSGCNESQKFIRCIEQTGRSLDTSQQTPLSDQLSIALSMFPAFIPVTLSINYFSSIINTKVT